MFRLDINGLRFIAVSMVVLFHFKFGGFYGGYAGVDVFFVISGFLMQEICSREIGKKGWVLTFYKKRFRRIYPALLFAVIFTSVLILYSETPSGVSEGFKQTISALTFTSNFYYQLFTGDYFATTAEFNWLLHTWSLSVEWQYYLLFPLALWISTKVGKYNSLFYAIIIATSILICIYFGPQHTKANFYLLPTRAWELMAGAFVSTLTVKNRMPRLTEALSILALIAFTVFSKDSGTWPGVMTIIPVAATALLLHANVGNEKTLLRHVIFQKVGSASYSIYLFHWPVVAFMANNTIEFTTFNSIVALLISVILGFVSYNYLESFYIKRDKALLASVLTFSALFLIMNKAQISKHWISKEAIVLDEYKSYTSRAGYKEQFGLDVGNCFISSANEKKAKFDASCVTSSDTKPNILLIGDSHAAQYAGSMRELFPEYNVMQATASGCMPFNGTIGEPRCVKLMNYIFNDLVENAKIDYIFITAFWSISKDKETNEKLINTIKSIKNAKVFVIGQTKSFSTAFYKIAQKANESDIEGLIQKKAIDTNNSMVQLFNKEGLNYLNVFNANCDANTCSYFTKDRVPMLFDDNHLTREWADTYVSKIKQLSGL
ncbi:TPA: acyltransferase [Klebsiella pneumoniae]|uniref:acyltransferase family protein n=1 Tax=Klebsiella pneumoniae TaxID=573 RepID=UPI001BA12753|nr:acyltransferase family protein [Klebsiella pneumoniae]MBR8629562.1 acyltransferase [Klebsiella pneumoniae subsp. pneumoniae]HBY9381953.1 acyltransferase [Klebsiella pneumoniae]HCA3716647.1 acyltransferase [Klebsiella pneumoniae]HCM4365859.1 acyltransferase [Klebsiella pneumoniae]HCM5644229.1 acyltransferase [Klebsiella pneumoniae]